MEKKVTSCCDDSNVPQATVATLDKSPKISDDLMMDDKKSTIEMESVQLPSSSTEETNGANDIANETMEKDIDANEALTDTQPRVVHNIKDIKEEIVDCTADSSCVVNKCELLAATDNDTHANHDVIASVENTPGKLITVNESDLISETKIETNTETEIEIDVEPKPKPKPVEVELQSLEQVSESKLDGNENCPSVEEKTPTTPCNATSSSSKSDTICVEEHCDSVESATTVNVEKISTVQHDENIHSNVCSDAKSDQLDSEIEQIDNNNSSTEQNSTENGSNDCDNSVENKVELNSAISANYACEMDKMEVNDATDKCETHVEPKPKPSEAKIPDVSKIERIEINVQCDELPSDSNTEANDKQVKMDIDPETVDTKEANEQIASETASSFGTSNSLTQNEQTPKNEQQKYTYDLNECVSSPEIAPIGFKDKFKKSFEIMEKSKQESNLIDKADKINDNGKINADAKTSDDQKQQHKSNVDNDIESSSKMIENDQNSTSTSTSVVSQQKKIDQTVVASIDLCDLTTENNKAKVVQTKLEPTMNCSNSTKEKNQSAATIPSKSIIHSHSTLDNQKDHVRSDLRQDCDIKAPTPIETRTIIISPPNKSRSDSMQAENNESKTFFTADSLSAKSGSLYVNNPDFSKSLRPSLHDLSGLKMKTPDFSKIGRSSELHVPNPDFTRAYDKLDTQRQSPLQPEVNPSNFAEISKKYNYISDLQLKNPLPTTSRTANEPTQSSTCSSLYVKPPDFSSKLRNKTENESEALEEPTPHIINKNMYRPHADSSSKSSASARSTPTHSDFSQISDDVTMSLQHSTQSKLLQSKSSVPPKPPTPVHRMDSRTVLNAPQQQQQQQQPPMPMPLPSPHIYSPTPLERPNSQNYYPHAMHPTEKVMPNIQKIYNDDLYQRNMAASPAHHQYSNPAAHIFHHRDVQMAIAPSQKIHPAYEQYHQSEKVSMPKSAQSTLETNVMRPSNDTSMYTRPASTNMLYHEQNRLKPIHLASEVHPSSSSSHTNTFNYSSGRPASALGSVSAAMHGMNKPPADFYNQMNPPHKWAGQNRITQSPISSAPSPHSISNQNARISQSQSPISASPLPYQMHRQSPNNPQYQSPHTTPSPSPFGYSPSPHHVKPNKIPANAPPNNIPPQSESHFIRK